MDRELIFELPNDVRCIKEAVDFVVRRCATCEHAARKLRFNLRVSLTEALANAMIYGNAQDPSKRVRIEVSVVEAALRARVTDQGNGFNPRVVPDPTCPENLERPCGRGIFLMRQLMDEVHFNDRGNAVTLILHLPDPESLPHEASA